ncbi:MAG: Sfum_1244 family protein [Gammaproteobacteria bacterium]
MTIDNLQSAIQHNCHISDSQFAGNYTLCIYLLKMREYYRWEKGIPLGKALDKQAVGKWMCERESFWESIEEDNLTRLHLNGHSFDAFDSNAINVELLPQGYIYSAGYGLRAKPLFFFGKLDVHIEEDGTQIYISAQELARDLAAPPAMSMGNAIFIRKESLQRMLWEKIEEWRWSKPDNAMGRAINHLDFEEHFEQSLDTLTEHEVATLILHEKGEVLAGQMIDASWHDMLNQCPHPHLELLARSVRDHLADALTTLPALLEKPSHSLHVYFANLMGMRKHIYPALLTAYNHWLETGKIDKLANSITSGQQHWLETANHLCVLITQDDAQKPYDGATIEAIIKQAQL